MCISLNNKPLLYCICMWQFNDHIYRIDGCRINSNTVLSLFWLQLRQTPAKPTILGFTAREMSQLPTRLCGRGHWNPTFCGWQGGCVPFQPPLTGGKPFFKIPLVLIFRPKGCRKNFNFFSHFHDLDPLQCTGMLCTPQIFQILHTLKMLSIYNYI